MHFECVSHLLTKAALFRMLTYKWKGGYWGNRLLQCATKLEDSYEKESFFGICLSVESAEFLFFPVLLI